MHKRFADVDVVALVGSYRVDADDIFASVKFDHKVLSKALYARHENGENDGCHDDEPWNDGCGNPDCAGSPSSGGSSSNDDSFWNGGCA